MRGIDSGNEILQILTSTLEDKRSESRKDGSCYGRQAYSIRAGAWNTLQYVSIPDFIVQSGTLRIDNSNFSNVFRAIVVYLFRVHGLPLRQNTS